MCEPVFAVIITVILNIIINKANRNEFRHFTMFFLGWLATAAVARACVRRARYVRACEDKEVFSNERNSLETLAECARACVCVCVCVCVCEREREMSPAVSV